LTGVAWRKALELRVHAEARPDLHLAVGHARGEPVQRPRRWAACHLALEVVHPAVARADEPFRRRDPANRASGMSAGRRDRDEIASLLARQLRIRLADVDRRL